MIKKLTLLSACVLFLGCNSAGRQQQQSLFSDANSTPTPNAPQVADEDSGFSFGKVLQLVGFNKQSDPATTANGLSSGVAGLQSSIGEVAARAAALSTSDAPEQTRQKALGILDSLNGLEQQLAASKSTGAVSGQLSHSLDAAVARIRGEAQRIVQGLPSAQSIPMIQQLASNLQATSGAVTGVLGQVNAATESFTNQSYTYPDTQSLGIPSPLGQEAAVAAQPNSTHIR